MNWQLKTCAKSTMHKGPFKNYATARGEGGSGSATRCYEGERGRCSGICYVTNHL